MIFNTFVTTYILFDTLELNMKDNNYLETKLMIYLVNKPNIYSTLLVIK